MAMKPSFLYAYDIRIFQSSPIEIANTVVKAMPRLSKFGRGAIALSSSFVTG